MAIEIRAARARDAASIVALVRGQRLNPTGLEWPNFHVAVEAGAIVAAAQLRPTGPEFGSLVVRADRRGAGITHPLIAAVLERAAGPVYLVCPVALAGLYRRHGFARITPLAAPGRVASHWLIGQASMLLALARRRRPRRMIVMARPAATDPAVAERCAA